MSLLEWSKALRELARRGGYRVVAVQSGRHQASGWIWDATHVVTVEHVLSARTHTQVTTAEGKTLPAQIVGAHPGLDLALLRLESEVEVVATASRLPESRYGVSTGVLLFHLSPIAPRVLPCRMSKPSNLSPKTPDP